MKDLCSLTKKEIQDFFNSFDRVLCDVDGVLWLTLEKIPGTPEGIKSLQKLGKRVVFVSNNGVKSRDAFLKQFQTNGFEVQENELITPVVAMVAYLKKINFTKEVYVIGMGPIRKELEMAGFQIAGNGPQRTKETLQDFVSVSTIEKHNVGAVIADTDLNLTYLKLQRAATFLQDPKVIFISGTTDCKVPIGLENILIGPGYFIRILEEISGRKSHALAKPSINFNDFIVEKLDIKDPSKVLFIGDSVPEDIGFAVKGGYQKLLVLSGLTKKEAVLNWKYPEELKPDYYVESLKTLHELVEKYFGNLL